MDNIKSKLAALRAVLVPANRCRIHGQLIYNCTTHHTQFHPLVMELIETCPAGVKAHALARTAVPALLDAVERILQYRDRMKIELANEDPELVAVANEALGQCCKIIVDALDGLEVGG